MDVKVLIGILNRPWLMEPQAGEQYKSIAHQVLYAGATYTAPGADKRKLFTSYQDLGAAYRVDLNGNVKPEGAIQVLKIEGPIAKADFCGSPGTLSLTQMLSAANADDTITGILLYTDSPGGQVDGTENFANAIRASAKPVVSFSDGMMCSAAYWLGSSAREIIVDGANNGWNATIGSIGTMVMWEDNSEKMAKEGIKRNTVFADASADKWGDYRAMQQGDYTRLKAELNGINETFLAAINTNRAGMLSDKENVLTGKTYNAKEALKYGLIDKIGSFSDAVKRVAALAKSSSKQAKTSTSMSTKNIAFIGALTAAKATEFKVVDGGFLLTEDNLNAIEAKLDSDATIIAGLTSQLKTLQAQEEAFKLNATAVADLATAQASLATAQNDLKTANEKISGLDAKIIELGAKPGAFFQTAGASDTQDPGEETDEEKAIAALPHNRKADKILG